MQVPYLANGKTAAKPATAPRAEKSPSGRGAGFLSKFCGPTNQRAPPWRSGAATTIRRLHTFANTLDNHADGICAYARFKLTTARIEAGNVAIGMIRKRARGLLDQHYFKLKIRQAAARALSKS